MIDLDKIPLYCIHLPRQVEREKTMYESLDYFRPNKDYTIINGYDCGAGFNKHFPASEGISLSFKRVIKEAKALGHKQIMICEDDVKFTTRESKSYMQAAVDTLPYDWDIVLATSYGCEFDDYNEHLKKIKSFTSLICVIINKSEIGRAHV